jgi:hypothetical protein
MSFPHWTLFETFRRTFFLANRGLTPHFYTKSHAINATIIAKLTIPRAEHLDLLGRIDPVFRQKVTDQVTNTLCSQFWFSSFQPETVGLRKFRGWRQVRILASVDAMSIRDDVTRRCLSENLR